MGIVIKIANTYCPGGEERDDLVQEICLQLWRSYPGPELGVPALARRRPDR